MLFTPAGMNQFKDHFLGKVKLDFTRATTSQKCLRTGDIDNVGRTAYHHTFFEMLGNFSFGDYFKREAISWAWEFLTDKKWLGIDPQRLSVSIYLDDDEAAEIWSSDVGLPSQRIVRMGEDDNFWPAGAPSGGPDGVCGPCSEIFFVDDDGQEVEIWNLVFTQFNRVGNPPDNLRPLPSKNIDTGMGLERIASVMQGQTTNYHIDILRPIVEATAEICQLAYEPGGDDGRRLRRITDHVRACTFAIHENVYPGPHKEKYVIRRLLRRAVLDGYQMGRREPFLHLLTPVVVSMMKGPYPELAETVERVQQVIRQEESAFLSNLDAGMGRIEKLFDDMQSASRVMIDGAAAFHLYETYGIPPELVEGLGGERGLTFDWEGFRGALEEHGGGGETVALFKQGPIETLKRTLQETVFDGYDAEREDVDVKGLVTLGEDRVANHGRLVEQLTAQDGEAVLILDRTPFYGESGGQIGDRGTIAAGDSVFRVEDTQKDGHLVLHYGRVESGSVQVGQATAVVDGSRRRGIRRAHSATHLLHHALQQTLGRHAQQQGSKVECDWLRFDFTNLEPVSASQLAEIERLVQQNIQQPSPIRWEVLPLAAARQAGAMMLFGEKYPDPVRMVSMGDYSKELCGGTHLNSTGDVECFEILSEEGVSAGTRRITAVTGRRALEQAEQTREAVRRAAELLDAPPSQLPEAVEALTNWVRALKKQLAGGPAAERSALGDATVRELDYSAQRQTLRQAARQLNVAPLETPARIEALLLEVENLQGQLQRLTQSGDVSADSLLERAETIEQVPVVLAELPVGNPNLMRQLIDQLRQKASPVAVLLAAPTDEKVLLVAGVSRDLVDRGVHSGKWVGAAAKTLGGGGGGKPDMAQAGGRDPSRIGEAFEAARKSIAAMLK